MYVGFQCTDEMLSQIDEVQKDLCNTGITVNRSSALRYLVMSGLKAHNHMPMPTVQYRPKKQDVAVGPDGLTEPAIITKPTMVPDQQNQDWDDPALDADPDLQLLPDPSWSNNVPGSTRFF